MPVFLSEPVSAKPVSLPFRFSGGFGLSSKTIGFMLSVQGVYSMFAMLFLWPTTEKRFGTLKTFRFVLVTWPLLYLVVPYLVLLPQRLQMPAIYFCLIWKITAQVFAFPSNAILQRRAAPSTLVLGMINGAAASSASLGRTIGPTLTGLIHSWGLEVDCTGIAWWAAGIICVVGALESFWIQEVGDEEHLENEALIDPLAIDAAINAAGHLPQHLEEGGIQMRGTSSKANVL